MVTSNPATNQPRASRWIFAPFVICLVFFLGYLVNSVALPTTTVEGTVTGKSNLPESTSYTTNIVGGRAWVQSSTTPDLFLITVKAGEQQYSAIVEQSQFDSYAVGQSVKLTIQTYRLTAVQEVVEISPTEAAKE